MKAKIVYIRKRGFEDEELKDLPEDLWDIAKYPPSYEDKLWDKFVIIPVEDDE